MCLDPKPIRHWRVLIRSGLGQEASEEPPICCEYQKHPSGKRVLPNRHHDMTGTTGTSFLLLDVARTQGILLTLSLRCGLGAQWHALALIRSCRQSFIIFPVLHDLSCLCARPRLTPFQQAPSVAFRDLYHMHLFFSSGIPVPHIGPQARYIYSSACRLTQFFANFCRESPILARYAQNYRRLCRV